MILSQAPVDWSEYDTVIIGGGVFGLSYAMAVINEQKQEQRHQRERVLILEQRTRYASDRTWSFWEDDDLPSYLADIVDNHYAFTDFSTTSSTHTLQHAQQRYCRLSSAHFYTLAQTSIATSSQVDLVLGAVIAAIDNRINEHPNAYDARNDWRVVRPSLMHQAFVGLVIKVPNHSYTADHAIVMGDMRNLPASEREQHSAQFVFDYILPIDEHTLLVEVTSFSAKPPTQRVLYDWTYQRILADFSPNDFVILEQEHAVLPMGQLPVKPLPKTQRSPRLAGGLGGMMRPATGYAFLHIQRQVAYLRGDTAVSADYSSLTLWLDRLFLAVIQRQPELCPQIFMAMVTRMPIQSFLAFMNNRLSLKVWLLVILSVPKKPFLQQLFSFHRNSNEH